mmetsp:Transcript_89289/g.277680  ORF Transcript_89289/g.277680 Transcript_89289/m.277680 type:complete len:489 (+) Transcript_89289:1532-2998(+)
MMMESKQHVDKLDRRAEGEQQRPADAEEPGGHGWPLARLACKQRLLPRVPSGRRLGLPEAGVLSAPHLAPPHLVGHKAHDPLLNAGVVPAHGDADRAATRGRLDESPDVLLEVGPAVGREARADRRVVHHRGGLGVRLLVTPLLPHRKHNGEEGRHDVDRDREQELAPAVLVPDLPAPPHRPAHLHGVRGRVSADNENVVAQAHRRDAPADQDDEHDREHKQLESEEKHKAGPAGRCLIMAGRAPQLGEERIRTVPALLPVPQGSACPVHQCLLQLQRIDCLAAHQACVPRQDDGEEDADDTETHRPCSALDGPAGSVDEMVAGGALLAEVLARRAPPTSLSHTTPALHTLPVSNSLHRVVLPTLVGPQASPMARAVRVRREERAVARALAVQRGEVRHLALEDGRGQDRLRTAPRVVGDAEPALRLDLDLHRAGTADPCAGAVHSHGEQGVPVVPLPPACGSALLRSSRAARHISLDGATPGLGLGI